MKTKGVYYLPSTDKIILISKCEYYEDLFNPAFSIVTWEQEEGIYHKTLIESNQFPNFVKIGSFEPKDIKDE